MLACFVSRAKLIRSQKKKTTRKLCHEKYSSSRQCLLTGDSIFNFKVHVDLLLLNLEELQVQIFSHI